MAGITASFDLPFAEQVAFFLRKRKNLVGTQRWNDLQKAQHDRAFVVAGAMKADLLADLHGAVQKAIDEGTTLETFRKDFRAIVEKHGWHGWTGEETEKGRAWRTRVIYETNLRSSYAAGRYAQLTDPELLARRPYWKYVHSDSVLHPRPQHLAWNGLVLRHDHPFWKTNYPPNGWGCACTVVAVRAPLDNDKTEPPTGWDEIDAKTGEPPGIDKGWGYAPGASVADELRRVVQNKIATLDAPLGAALWQDAAPSMSAPLRKAAEDFIRETTTAMQARGESALMHVIHPEVAAQMEKMGHPMATAGVWLADRVLLHSIRDTKAAKGVALPSSTWENLPALLERAKVYLDTEDNRLLFVFSTQETPAGKSEKVAVAVDYVKKTRIAGAQGKRVKMLSNYIRTGAGPSHSPSIHHGGACAKNRSLSITYCDAL